jgi:hypothetical protein
VKDVLLQVFVRRHERVPADLVDVHVLQSQSTPGTMFQVASNFNCLEAANEMVDYGSGMFVTKLMTDRTQGPAASSACSLAAVVRAHLAFADTDTLSPGAAAVLGQRPRGRQVELLGDETLAPYFPVVNGKLFVGGGGDLSRQACAVLPTDVSWEKVRVGLHCDAVPMFRRAGRGDVEVNVGATHTVDQVFVAGLDLRARRLRHLSKAAVGCRMSFLLEGAYHGTYGACRLRRSKVLVLTLVGGGVFGNPWPAIGRAIGKAHKQWVGGGLCPALKAVHLPLFVVPTKDQLDTFVKSIEAEGVRVSVCVV